MDIFESLENLNVSESCFEDILKIVENKELTPNKERHLEKLSHKIAKAKVKEQEQGRTKKVGDKIDAAYNKHANKYHEYVTGSKDYDGLSPKELAQANGYALESLENLNVSEECFDEIMGIVEDLLSEDVKDIEQRIEKKYGKPSGYLDHYKDSRNKSAKLIDKFHSARKRELESAAQRNNYKKLRISTNVDDWIDNPKTVSRYSKGLNKEEENLIKKRGLRSKGSFYPLHNVSNQRGENEQINYTNPPSDILGSYEKAKEKSITRHNKKKDS